jgi:hypothetical protein
MLFRLAKVTWQFLMTAAAFNLWRLPKNPSGTSVGAAKRALFNTATHLVVPCVP